MQVFSLVCWGGRTGTTATMTIASPCVVTTTLKSNHGLRDGTGLVFSTTGALPTGVTAGTTYYTRYVAANTFHLYDTEAHAKDTASTTGRVNTSGTQSGTHTAKSKRMLDLLTQYSGRWGDSGSERCYDGLLSWNSARSGANAFDIEVCEIGQDFIEINGANIAVNVPCLRTVISTKVNGIYSEAFHNGIVGTGYTLRRRENSSGAYCIYASATYHVHIDGFSLDCVYEGNYGVVALLLSKPDNIASNMIAIGRSTSYGTGFSLTGPYTQLYNCLSMGWSKGFNFGQYQAGYIVANCTAVKNGTGFGAAATSSINGFYYNNISVGNTTNWYACTGQEGAASNAGESGNSPWVTGANSTVTLATTDFANWDGNVLSPALSSSPQVDVGVEIYGLENDISDAERPNYNNGGAEAFDVGCYEFDHGYGNHPETATISLTNIASGSRVLITRDDTSAVLYNDVPGTSLDFETGYIGAFTVIIRKASASPYYREFNAGGTTVANQTSAIKVMQQLDE